jgi:hypothetical protein
MNALRLLAEGKTPTEVSHQLRLPQPTVFAWSKRFEGDITRLTNNSLRSREAFHQVVARYNDIRSIMGSPGAMDYAHITGGSGAKYAPDKGIGFQMIDFTVDVDNAIKSLLTSKEQEFWREHIQDKDYDMSVQTAEFLRFQEFLGREFMIRGLYPVAEYFGDVKERVEESNERRT